MDADPFNKALLFAFLDNSANCSGLFKTSFAIVFFFAPFLTCDLITSCPAFLRTPLLTIPPTPAPTTFKGSNKPTPKLAKNPDAPLPPSS